MRAISEADVMSVARCCKVQLDLAAAVASDYYSCLPLCVLDAVFSINARYESTKNVVARYCAHAGLTDIWRERRNTPPRESQHSVKQLVTSIEQIGVEPFARCILKNRQRTSTRSGILKAEATLLFAKVLCESGVDYLQDVSRILPNGSIAETIRSIPGHGSGISLTYFLMLAGSEELIKPDRMIHRFLKDCLGYVITDDQAQDLIQRACRVLRPDYPSLTPGLLDHCIWTWVRSRPRAREP